MATPLNHREYREAIRSHLIEVKSEAPEKDPPAAIPAPEAPSYGRYTYNAMNVILTRGRHHFDLVTNDRETLKKEIRNMARKESLQDYMAVQIRPAGGIEQDKRRQLRREMGSTLDRVMKKCGRRTGMQKGGRFPGRHGATGTGTDRQGRAGHGAETENSRPGNGSLMMNGTQIHGKREEEARQGFHCRQAVKLRQDLHHHKHISRENTPANVLVRFGKAGGCGSARTESPPCFPEP